MKVRGPEDLSDEPVCEFKSCRQTATHYDADDTPYCARHITSNDKKHERLSA